MSFNPQLIQNICKMVTDDGAKALQAQRLTQRQARLAEPEVLTLEQAEFHDLNQLIISVLQEAMPLCQAYGIKMILQQDPRLPEVPLLVRPLEDALAAALDLCIEEGVAMLRIKTGFRRDRIVAIFERCSEIPPAADRATISDWDSEFGWYEAGSMGRIELMIGDRTTRALGGRMRVFRRDNDIRWQLELPIWDRPTQTWEIGNDDTKQEESRAKGFVFPGINSNPLSEPACN